jgi:hypothetical protein
VEVVQLCYGCARTCMPCSSCDSMQERVNCLLEESRASLAYACIGRLTVVADQGPLKASLSCHMPDLTGYGGTSSTMLRLTMLRR